MFTLPFFEKAYGCEKPNGCLLNNIVDVDVEKILDLPLGKFKTALKNAPNGVQQAVKNIAGEKILDGSLDSLAKIKAIDEILGTDLKLYLS